MRLFCYICITTLLLSVACNRSKLESTPAHSEVILSGEVLHQSRPVAEALVRVKGTPNATRTDSSGRFSFSQLAKKNGKADRDPMTLTAWKKGFFIGSDRPDEHGKATIELHKHPTVDCERYEWVDPTPNATESQNCGNCHGDIYNEWKSGGHARSATGKHFLNLYDGTNWHGVPDQGWNLLKEYPHGATVCFSCHAPTATMQQMVSEDFRKVEGVAKQGVHCDYCHKIEKAPTENLGIAHGRFGVELLRPEHEQLFFGPLDDVDRGEDVYSELQTKSEICAACHEGIVFGVHVYSTYSEWLNSPARAKGKQCQDCHMKPTGTMTNIAPGVGGIERDPKLLASHQLFGGDQEKMIKDCLNVKIQIQKNDSTAVTTISITPTNVGHSVPTGFIDRHLILLVEGTDTLGNKVAMTGSILPKPAGNHAGKAGFLFAKRLVGEQQVSPIPFWRTALQTVDTRLQPGKTFVDRYDIPAAASQLRVRILYRRFWHEVYVQKDWPNDELTIFDKRLAIE